MRYPHIVLSVTASLCAVIGITSCHTGAGDAAGKAPSIPTAKVAVAQRGDMATAVTLVGQFQPYQVVDVHPKVSGYMQKINVDIGDIVHTGEVLAILDVPELRAQLRQSAYALKQSKEAVARAQQEINRAVALNYALHAESVRLENAAATQPGLIAQQELDDARAKDLDSQAQIEAATAAMAAAQQHEAAAQADFERYTALENYTYVTAPFDGVVIWRYADTGALIQGGTNTNDSALPIVRVSQSGLLRLRFPVPENDVRTIHIGDVVPVRVDATNHMYYGKVIRFTRSVNFETRTMETEIDIKNPDLTLTPGMYADANLPLDTQKNVITVPISALVMNGDQQTVYLVDKTNHVHIRNVTLGVRGQFLAAVTSGLAVGDRVIDGGQEKYQEGELVVPRIISTPASETTQQTGGMIDMKKEEAVTDASLAPN
ncbi:MAG: efflux RND transporter periplasmic adaptor subunit [Acidobacteriaceae bacterium]